MEDEKYVLRLVNGNETERVTEFSCQEAKIAVHFGKYEVKMVVFDGKTFEIQEIWT